MEIRLTKEGTMLHTIALKLEKCVTNAEKELLKIMNKRCNLCIWSIIYYWKLYIT